MSASPTSDRPPPRFQFRLGTLLMAMVVIGIASAALAMPTPFWDGTLLCLVLLSLLTTVLLAIYRIGRTRAFAVGFLVFAVGYLACVFAFDQELRKFEWQAPMPTSRIAFRIYVATHAQNRQTVTLPAPNQGGSFGMGGGMPSAGMPTVATRTMTIPIHNGADFIEITHSVLSLLLGFLGGAFARFLYLTRPETDQRRTAPAA